MSTLCHPSDIVAVLRELKESGAAPRSTVNLVYRIRRKNSGYLWMEASGGLYSAFRGFLLPLLCFFRQEGMLIACWGTSNSRTRQRKEVCHSRREGEGSLQNVVVGFGADGRVWPARVLVKVECRGNGLVHDDERAGRVGLHFRGDSLVPPLSFAFFGWRGR